MTTKPNRLQMQQEALNRARNGASLTNYAAIFEGFAAKGIGAADIHPRENVLTFNAWKALGRYVRKGEKGVKVVTFIECKAKDDSGETFRRPSTTTVFHVSQTEAAN